jgi:GT2 family glycosyltransferase
MTDATNHDVSPRSPARDEPSEFSETLDLQDQITRLTKERDQLSEALIWATHQLGILLDSPELRPKQFVQPVRRARQLVDEAAESTEDLDAFHEPGVDDPYPLNAAEDRRAYHRWLSHRREAAVVGGQHDELVKVPTTKDPKSARPLISVIVPVWRTPLWALERCVGSIFRQDFADWELCLCDDGSDEQELASFLNALGKIDRRIQVTALVPGGGISEASNTAVASSSGLYLAFLDHDDELAPNALSTMASTIARTPEADFLYSDEDKIDVTGERFDPLFKPDWSPDLLLSFAYTCHLTVISRSLFDEVGGLRCEFDGSQDYDLALRATERAKKIVHISEVLYHWRTLPGSAATDTSGSVAKPWAYDAGLRAIEDALIRRREPGVVFEDQSFPGRYHVSRAIQGDPRVSIIIPFRDEPAMLATCIQTMRTDPGHNNFEFVLINNNSELPETKALLDRLSDDHDIIIVDYPKPFNWSAVNNFGARFATGEIFLFSNNDIEVHKPDWLSALVAHAQRPEVGAVGAKLVYPDGSIQHAGVVIGLGGIAGHILRGLPGDRPGYNSTSISTRNCSAVTGACLMTRREIFERAGGFNEELPVAFNDVDFCLKLRELGLLIVYTPLAELIHHESRSRGHTDDLVEHAIVVSRWANEIIEGDPYMNKNLSHWRYWCPLATTQEDYQWKTYLDRSISTQRSSSSV